MLSFYKPPSFLPIRLKGNYILYYFFEVKYNPFIQLSEVVEDAGKSYREGISIIELAEMIPDEAAATEWLRASCGMAKEACPKCGSMDTRECKNHRPMPYFCRDCKGYFSVRTGTVLERSHIPLKKWAWAIYLWTTSLKGVSSMKLHRDLKISQKSAWFMAHRLRETFTEADIQFDGPVEVEKPTWAGSPAICTRPRGRNAPDADRTKRPPVVGMKDRETNQVTAKVMDQVTGDNLQGFVTERIHQDTMVLHRRCSRLQGIPAS